MLHLFGTSQVSNQKHRQGFINAQNKAVEYNNLNFIKSPQQRNRQKLDMKRVTHNR